MTPAPASIDDLGVFITASPSSYHAAAEVARRLSAAGFVALDETVDWKLSAGGYYVVRDGAIVAWLQPHGATPITPFRIVGAHTDSPAFKLKPKPTVGAYGWLQAGVEVYGGPLLNSWLDRELELAGRIVTRDGSERLVRTGPFLRIPQLAVHLDREANTALTLDRQRQLTPVFGVGDVDHADLIDHLAGLAGVAAAEVAGYDILTADTQAPRRFGLHDELFAAGRLDNLSSVYAGVAALIAAAQRAAAPIAAEPIAAAPIAAQRAADAVSASGHAGRHPTDAPQINVLAAFDHEELGSESRSGANGPLLEDVLTRIAAAAGASVADRLRAFAASWCVSADAGHAIHPNYPERHDPVNRPIAGGGPLLKINANQRYATDAHGAALLAGLCERAGVPYQEFVSNNTVPCGTTIGPLTATRLGIRTVDVGIPLLSMHSARELCHVDDPLFLVAAITEFFVPSAAVVP